MKQATLDAAKEAQTDAPTPGLSNMRSRLQRLADQRHYWDSKGRQLSLTSWMHRT